MKTFFKTNLIAIFAVLLAVGTMSFKMVEKQNLLTAQWYPVDGDTIHDDGDDNPPVECTGFRYTCALQIEMVNPSDPLPSTVTEAEELEEEGKLFIRDRKFKGL